MVAPEGATNNLSGEMAPLEPGVAQLAFWAAEDMARNQDPRSLHVIPVGIRYSWRRPNWTVLDARLQALEQHLGVQVVVPEDRRERLLRIGAALITALEQLERLKANPEQPLADRIENYRLHGLQKAESHFGLRRLLQERCRRIEQAAWDRIYRENLEQLPPLERSLVDWEAREADLQLTRMRLVEHFTSVSGHCHRSAGVRSLRRDGAARGGGHRMDRRPALERITLLRSSTGGVSRSDPRRSTPR